jgi:hypothetical protein
MNGRRILIAAPLAGLFGLAVLAAHGLALRVLFSRAALAVGAMGAIVVIAIVLHLGLLAPLASRLRGHLFPKRD